MSSSGPARLRRAGPARAARLDRAAARRRSAPPPTGLPPPGRRRFACTSIRSSGSVRPGGCGCGWAASDGGAPGDPAGRDRAAVLPGPLAAAARGRGRRAGRAAYQGRNPRGLDRLELPGRAAREWLTPRPGRRLSTVACALLVAAGSLGISAGLLASPVPARAAITGQAHGPAHCRPGPPEPVPGMIPAMGRPRVISWEAWHGRSC